MTKDELILAVMASVPYANQIKELDTQSDPTAIRFTWRGNKFRVSETCDVEEVGDMVLVGSDIAILMRSLIFGSPL